MRQIPACDHDLADISVHGQKAYRLYKCVKCGFHFVQDTPDTEIRFANFEPGEIQVLPGLQWTSDKPTKPGWYWYRKAGEGPHYADFSHTSGGDIYLVTFDGAEGQVMLPFDEGHYSLDDFPGEWAGPLEPPSA